VINDPSRDPHRGKRLAGQTLVSIGALVAILYVLGFILNGGWAGADLVEGLIGGAVIAGVPLLAGYLLLRNAGPRPQLPSLVPGQVAPMSGLRVFFVVTGVLIMLFAGGCTLLFLGSFLFDSSGAPSYVTVPVVLIFGGPPLAVGLAILLVALKAGRRRGS
jgi:hypothetical protein